MKKKYVQPEMIIDLFEISSDLLLMDSGCVSECAYGDGGEIDVSETGWW